MSLESLVCSDRTSLTTNDWSVLIKNNKRKTTIKINPFIHSRLSLTNYDETAPFSNGFQRRSNRVTTEHSSFTTQKSAASFNRNLGKK